MTDPEANTKPLSATTWVVANMITPALGFVCLRASRAIGTRECILGLLAGLTAHFGIGSVLAKTNGAPLQVFLVHLLAVCLYLVFAWQYWAGERAGVWSDKARRYWRFAAILSGGFIGVGLALAVALFHLSGAIPQ